VSVRAGLAGHGRDGPLARISTPDGKSATTGSAGKDRYLRRGAIDWSMTGQNGSMKT
jgi:hypothetical protein